jgi:CheY-like chemotaxis protein
MNFKALLVSQDEAAKATVGAVLEEFDLRVQSCSYDEALDHLASRAFHLVLADFDQSEPAFRCLHHANGAVTAALISDTSRVRDVFGAGAAFVLYKPVVPAQAGATLRAAMAILKRERRHAIRIPVQVPVWIRIQSDPEIEAILLDVSENGMEILSEHPLAASSSIAFRFSLSDSLNIEGRGEVAWARNNGQAGVRFYDLNEETRASLKSWVLASADAKLPEELDSMSICRLTDISLGACYVETDSPYPENLNVAMRLQAAGMVTEAHGTVRVMHPSFGMGIQFAMTTSAQMDEVNAFIQLLLSHPEVTPELTVTPHPLAVEESSEPLHDMDDPLLDLLQHHGGMSQQQFLDSLHGQRSMRIE